MAPRVVLVGPPGSGKTTVAALLAAHWGDPMRDTDADVVAAQGAEIADIFVDRGEPAFRELESAAVALALDEHEGVLALGGGAVLDPTTRELLAAHTVVLLDVGVAAAVRRVGLDSARPLLLGNVRSQMRTLLEARRPHYLAVATHVVPTDDLAPEDVATRVVALVEATDTDRRVT
ncbi:shikimate kinase [Solicola sp. PLA-1-18]|uniref:shikimate kinase n=1 Tax=Solicola sp. PLA-1-18 TaxID=3380532 RepID=UPI003B79256C